MPMPGGAPPPMPGAPPPGGGTGPAATHGPMAGNAAQGMAKLKVALQALNESLTMLPMTGKLHSKVAKAVSDIGAEIADSAGSGGDQIQQLLDMIRTAKTQGGPPAGASGGAPPGAPPIPPGMGAAPPPPAMLQGA